MSSLIFSSLMLPTTPSQYLRSPSPVEYFVFKRAFRLTYLASHQRVTLFSVDTNRGGMVNGEPTIPHQDTFKTQDSFSACLLAWTSDLLFKIQKVSALDCTSLRAKLAQNLRDTPSTSLPSFQVVPTTTHVQVKISLIA
ncbi:hypothetical protein L915_01384 [Phytophthora nicotianae]|uniref:Uncharacterized protein n=1 Tax=Phytophthora nicotianae TaxID=4792 RepID=W2HKC4_PHYNI|nr:hypothetical protein L915_01384 [Phytophthora nicotianae]